MQPHRLRCVILDGVADTIFTGTVFAVLVVSRPGRTDPV